VDVRHSQRRVLTHEPSFPRCRLRGPAGVSVVAAGVVDPVGLGQRGPSEDAAPAAPSASFSPAVWASAQDYAPMVMMSSHGNDTRTYVKDSAKKKCKKQEAKKYAKTYKSTYKKVCKKKYKKYAKAMSKAKSAKKARKDAKAKAKKDATKAAKAAYKACIKKNTTVEIGGVDWVLQSDANAGLKTNRGPRPMASMRWARTRSPASPVRPPTASGSTFP
jgi:hypothetical protein